MRHGNTIQMYTHLRKSQPPPCEFFPENTAPRAQTAFFPPFQTPAALPPNDPPCWTLWNLPPKAPPPRPVRPARSDAAVDLAGVDPKRGQKAGDFVLMKESLKDDLRLAAGELEAQPSAFDL